MYNFTFCPDLVTLVLKFTVRVNLLSCAINSFAFRCLALRKKCYGNVILPQMRLRGRHMMCSSVRKFYTARQIWTSRKHPSNIFDSYRTS